MGKIIGGEYVYTWGNAYYKNMAYNFPAKTLAQLINSGSTLTVWTNDYTAIQISPDSAHVIIGSSGSPYLRVINVETEDYVSPIVALPTSHPLSIRFKPDGTEFAMGLSGSPHVIRYTYPDYVRQTDPPVAVGGQVNCIAYSGDGTKLAVAMNVSPYIKIYSLPSMTDISPAWVSPPTAALLVLSFSPDSTHIFVGGTATGAGNKAYNVTTGANLFSNTTDCYACDHSPDGTKVAVVLTTPAKTTRIYDTTTWTVLTDIPFGTPLGSTVLIANTVRHIDFFDNDYFLVHAERGAGVFNYTTGLIVPGLYIANASSTVGKACMSPRTLVRKIAGTVTDGAAGALARTVKAFDSVTGKFLGKSVSDAGTGVFSFVIFSAELATVIAYGEGGEVTQIFDKVTPATL